MAEKLHASGFPQERTTQVVVSVFDYKLDKTERWAITMANLSYEELHFIGLKWNEDAIHMPMSDKIVVFAELRQADVDKTDWQKYGEIASLDIYVSTILGAIGALDECILHRTTVKSGFLGKRLQIPGRCRNALYAKSGLFGVQFKAARRINDPPEVGLEVVKDESGRSWLMWCNLSRRRKDFSLVLHHKAWCTYALWMPISRRSNQCSSQTILGTKRPT